MNCVQKSEKQQKNEFGLSEKTMQTISAIYEKFPAVKRVIVYGSRAMGNFREGSDIDMTLVGDKPIDYDTVLKLYGMFDDSDLPYLVDISDFSSLKNPDLIDHINRRGKVLYERTEK